MPDIDVALITPGAVDATDEVLVRRGVAPFAIQLVPMETWALATDLAGYQPLDGDLTSLAGSAGTNTIYYRSAASTWSPVTIGANLTFAAGTLAASSGGGSVFLDNAFRVQDDVDNTRQVALEVSGVTTGTTRTLTVPNGDGTLALTALAQTLQNKTLDNTNTVTVRDGSLIMQRTADATARLLFNLGNIPTATDRTLTWPTGGGGTLALQGGGANVFTGTNAFNDVSWSLRDDADNTKVGFFQLSGVTTGQTRTLTWPDATGTIVLADATQTLTNKSIVATQLTGTLAAAQEPAHTGDVTNAAGSLALAIAANAVTNAKLATMAANTVKTNATNAVAVPTDVALAASQLFGRGATGDISPIVLGTNLSMAGATLNAAGGSGAPGGATTQVQYNNAGAFAGATEVAVADNQLRLEATTSLTAPAASGVKMIARADAGRTVPAFLSQDGTARELQASLGRGSLMAWLAQPGSASVSGVGLSVPTATGTATLASPATTNLFTYTPRVEYLVTVAATTAVAGFRSTTGTVTVGGPSAGLGGFTFIGRWGPATGVATTTSRAFFGLANITSAPADSEPSAQVSCVFMGWDAADTNIQIMHNDGTGTCTKVDLGASFPVPVTDRTELYELALYSPKGTTQSISWRVTNRLTAAVATGTISTDMPTTANLLTVRGWMSVGGTSAVIGIALNTMTLDPLLT